MTGPSSRRLLALARTAARSSPSLVRGWLAGLLRADRRVHRAAHRLRRALDPRPPPAEARFWIGAAESGPRTVVCYNSAWAARPPVSGAELPDGWALTNDRTRLAEAAAVVFHLPTLEAPPRLPKPAGQLWVAWSMEAAVNLPPWIDEAFLARCELQMSHRRGADVFAPYFGPALLPGLRETPPAKPADRLVAYLASNAGDHVGRSRYVMELMRHLDVHSYGRCLRTRRLGCHDNGRGTKLELVSSYRFTLAFENAIEEDYVTEKFFDPLVAGSVPVYWGAPNVARFAPGRRCYIDVRDFSGARALARHLREVAADPAAYAEYHAWRREPLRPELVALTEAARGEPFVRLVRRVASARRAGSRS